MPNFFVTLGNVGKLCFGSGCNLYSASCDWRDMPATQSHKCSLKKVYFLFGRCKRICILTCPTRHSSNRILKKMIVWSSPISQSCCTCLHPFSPPFSIPHPHTLPQPFSIFNYIPRHVFFIFNLISIHRELFFPFQIDFKSFSFIFINFLKSRIKKKYQEFKCLILCIWCMFSGTFFHYIL